MSLTSFGSLSTKCCQLEYCLSPLMELLPALLLSVPNNFQLKAYKYILYRYPDTKVMLTAFDCQFSCDVIILNFTMFKLDSFLHFGTECI